LFERSAAGVVLVTRELAETKGACRSRVVVERPHDALLSLLPRFYQPPVREPGVHATAVVAPSATLGADVRIEAYAVIGANAAIGDRAWIGSHTVVGEAVRVGADTRLHPHVTLYPGSVVGERVILHSGVRVGSDGFGYVFRGGAHVKIPHVGRCLIGNDVEIGANSTMDRGSIDDTVVGDGTKIDNLVHVAHNVRIGRLCLLMAQVGIAGSSRIEDGATLAGQVGIAGHLTVGARAILAAQAGVISDVPSGETWSGYPARPHREAMRASAALFKLSSLLKRLERLLAREAE
jgi:UDP-3-O-[3-hydroxymyristoyl] glucosamine N-acyltransferase